MKICYVIDGNSIHIARIARHFYKLGHEIHIITHRNDLFDEPYTIHQIPLNLDCGKLPYQWIWAALRPVIKKIAEIKPDILHGFYISNIPLYMIFGRAKRKILSGMGDDILIWPERDINIRRLETASIALADCITVESEVGVAALKKIHVPDQKIYKIPWGIDRIRVSRRDRYNNNNNEISVVSIRNFETVYNIECLIKAIKILDLGYPKINYIIAGRGSKEHELKSLANDLGVSHKINFIGHLEHSDIFTLLKASDVYVSTSVSDGRSVSLLEAMACGCIPVVTDIPVNREIIQDGVNGYLFSNDPRILAAKISHCIERMEKAECIHEKNISILENEFIWEDNMEMMRKLYERPFNLRSLKIK